MRHNLNVKPSREPDFISPVGSYFWFEELVLLGLDGLLREIFLEEESSLLRVHGPVSSCEDCWRCKNKQDCERAYFKEEVQEAYRRWNAKLIEQALGLESLDGKEKD